MSYIQVAPSVFIFQATHASAGMSGSVGVWALMLHTNERNDHCCVLFLHVEPGANNRQPEKQDNVQFMQRLQQMSRMHASGNSEAVPTDGRTAQGTAAAINPLVQHAQEIRNNHRLLHDRVCTMPTFLLGALSLELVTRRKRNSLFSYGSILLLICMSK